MSTLTIEVSGETYERLLKLADQAGCPLEEFLTRWLTLIVRKGGDPYERLMEMLSKDSSS